MSILHSIRPVTLLYIATTMVVVKYGFITAVGTKGFLSPFLFFCIIVAVVCITASGYFIHYMFDHNTYHNKIKAQPVKGRSKNWMLFYLLLTHIGIFLGVFVSFSIKKPLYSVLFIVIALCFYAYARIIKRWFLINNLFLSLLFTCAIFTFVLFDFYPTTLSFTQHTERNILQTIGYIALAVFYLNFVSEVIKDIENINTDFINNRKTYAIVLGRERATMFVFLLTAAGFFALVLLSITIFKSNTLLLVYTLLCVSIPLLWICKITWNASTPKDYKKMSALLKVTIILGLGIILLLPSFYNS